MKKPVLKEIYQTQVVPELKKLYKYDNPHQVPNIVKIVINSRIKAEAEKQHIADVQKDVAAIAGQKPVLNRARGSVANFKVREGMPLGVSVTLRGDNMWEFLLRLITVTLPNIRDFRGVSRKLDGRGNYTLGIADHTIFPEITVETGRKAVGMDITIVTNAGNDEHARELLRLLGMPFRQALRKTAVAGNQPAA